MTEGKGAPISIGVIGYSEVSPNIAHTGEVSTHNLRKVVQRLAEDPETAGEFAKAEEIRVWSDCGLHFRCEAVAKFVLVDIPTMSPRPFLGAALAGSVQKHQKIPPVVRVYRQTPSLTVTTGGPGGVVNMALKYTT